MAALRILLVDDEPALVALLVRQLERSGHAVRPFLSAELALSALDAGDWTPDLLIVDYVLPGQSGTTLAGLLLDRFPGLVCLISTGHSLSLDDLPPARRARTGILQKPFSPKELEAAIGDALAGTL
jgi:DNA-binding response OmpR family regulator